MIKNAIYSGAKWTGAFRAARAANKRGVRILAYHGFALADEDQFNTGLFMRAELFRRRMEYLIRHGYRVLSLSDAVACLKKNDVPEGATVLTFDDGFYSIWKLAMPILQELKLPATIYVTSYYSVKGTPIFGLAVQYMFWKTTRTALNLTELEMEDKGTVQLLDMSSTAELMWKIIRHGESRLNEDQRVQLCHRLGSSLGVDYAQIAEQRLFSVMTPDEIQEAAKSGVDIELHTHRHCLPVEPALIRKEIEQNREILEPLAGRNTTHFCYPSGLHRKEHQPVLAQLGVESATTCDNGLNYSDTPMLALSRFLDGNNVSQIEFEAEMSGLAGMIRTLRSRAGRPAANSGNTMGDKPEGQIAS